MVNHSLGSKLDTSSSGYLDCIPLPPLTLPHTRYTTTISLTPTYTTTTTIILLTPTYTTTTTIILLTPTYTTTTTIILLTPTYTTTTTIISLTPTYTTTTTIISLTPTYTTTTTIILLTPTYTTTTIFLTPTITTIILLAATSAITTTISFTPIYTTTTISLTPIKTTTTISLTHSTIPSYSTPTYLFHSHLIHHLLHTLSIPTYTPFTLHINLPLLQTYYDAYLSEECTVLYLGLVDLSKTIVRLSIVCVNINISIYSAPTDESTWSIQTVLSKGVWGDENIRK
ncbi:hypothetical protein Pmani_006433 [Petrolisthes manimaculis]|uniref:Uncharacterized protein n=1 Tax=Petrolisthes manimaculis TaxID=1843537 RepID=A0AAE1QBP8_9EUCA|nr:hypothetical protein Pmani_006433 [Petrolisthes manimaculis]